MMIALRTTPDQFEINQGWLHHIPSRHDFRFDPEGNVRIRAECNCASLSVSREQSHQLTASYKEWQTHYWQPLLTNREFASHFRYSPVRKALIDVVGWLYHRLMQKPHRHYREEEIGAMYPAE
jgi:hypothetical protein